MKKQFFKFFAVIMSIAILITSLPLTAFSFDFSSETTESNVTSTEDAQEKEKDIIELTEKRTADTKYFRLEDGSYYVAQYDTDVHYLDDNGTWKNIDNTLTESGSEISTKNAKIKF